MRVSVALFVATLSLPSFVAGAVDFARDIQPIFARHCYECHGAETQKGSLRLDEKTAAIKVVTPGKPAESELLRRVTLPKGHEDIMPNRGEPLSKKETDLLTAWIAEGANWPDSVQTAAHWAYVPPSRPVPPTLRNGNGARNPIDQFVFARLEQENLAPSPEADRAILLRRVYLDLVGIPPSPAEVKTFVSDPDPHAYNKVVERLLASPQYGERWARPWLDLARYADSSGYQRDNLWDIWPYRDWVINALNHDMPFDQFTIEQLAGDLLPNASVQQKVATGFNRCVPTNVEAGADQEETRVNQVFDRVNTLGAVWLGSTLECAQCHNHKYDPISQKEYYQLFAFFNNTPRETDLRNPKATVALKFVGPYLSVPDEKIDKRRDTLRTQIQALTEQIEKYSSGLDSSMAAWEQSLQEGIARQGQIQPLEIATFDAESGSLFELLEDKSVLLVQSGNDAIPNRDTYTVTVKTTLTNITGFKLETLTHPSLPARGPGRAAAPTANFVLNTFAVKAAPADSAAAPYPVKLTKAKASHSQARFQVAGAIDDDPRSGWAIGPQFSQDHWATFELVKPIRFEAGGSLEFTLEQNNGAARNIGRLRLSAFTGKVEVDALPSEIVTILGIAEAGRTDTQKKQLKEYRLASDPQLARWRKERTQLQNELNAGKAPQTLVMQEMQERRITPLFKRGNFLDPGEPVQPATPAVLHPFPDGPRNRLTLAQWMVSTNNPLVARVTVNRWWAEFFGHGLVSTPEDFGIKGEFPTHPDLLDWLAVEFMVPTTTTNARPWSMKHIHRLIVTSATYRQSSVISADLLERDDKNKLYARGPRFRMEAEMIRDNALAIAGLLSFKQGGPPVRPYQPPGLWESKVGGDAITYTISEGEDRYRRGIYTVWKRTSPYPSFINFDATDRNACTVKRSRSNTPLQALTLLNDPVYVEAAAAMAKRILREAREQSLNAKLSHAFALAVARPPQPGEIAVLEHLYREQLAASREKPEGTRKLLGPFLQGFEGDVAELAAWHAVAWALLNLNETITKG